MNLRFFAQYKHNKKTSKLILRIEVLVQVTGLEDERVLSSFFGTP